MIVLMLNVLIKINRINGIKKRNKEKSIKEIMSA